MLGRARMRPQNYVFQFRSIWTCMKNALIQLTRCACWVNFKIRVYRQKSCVYIQTYVPEREKNFRIVCNQNKTAFWIFLSFFNLKTCSSLLADIYWAYANTYLKETMFLVWHDCSTNLSSAFIFPVVFGQFVCHCLCSCCCHLSDFLFILFHSDFPFIFSLALSLQQPLSQGCEVDKWS